MLIFIMCGKTNRSIYYCVYDNHWYTGYLLSCTCLIHNYYYSYYYIVLFVCLFVCLLFLFVAMTTKYISHLLTSTKFIPLNALGKEGPTLALGFII